MEIEGKLIVPDPGVYWMLQSIQYAAGYSLVTQQADELFDTYLDTPYHRISAAGYSYRRRERRDGILMTIKSLSQANGGIHRRQVLEVKLARSLPPRDWPECTARQQMLQIIGSERLLPILNMQQTRIVRLMKEGKQTVAKLNLDRVAILVDNGEHVYLDLEAVLRPGFPEEILISIMDYFQEEWRVEPQPRSKFERGMRLLEGADKVDMQRSPVN